jgi:hypothetical protein
LKLEGKEEYPDGTWASKGMKQNPDGTFEETETISDADVQRGLESWDGDFKHQRAKHLRPATPHCLAPLQKHVEELDKYWKTADRGALIMRLDSIDLPPRPRIQRLIRIADDGEKAVAVPKGAFLRQGPRWVTLCVPQIDRGKYLIEWVHGSLNFMAEFDIIPHCTTAVEIDGHLSSSGKDRVAVLSGDNTTIAEHFQQGLTDLSMRLKTRDWDVGGDFTFSKERS